MPQIQEYLPQQEAQGAVGATSPNIELAGAVGRSIENLGGAINQGGQLLHRRAAQEETADVYADFADKRAAYTAQVQQQTQDGTLDIDKLKEQYDNDTHNAGSDYSTPEARNYFERQQSRLRGHLIQMATSGQAQISANAAKGAWKLGLDKNSLAVENDPGSFEDTYNSSLESVDALISSGGLPEKMRDQAVQQMGSTLASAAVNGWAKLDPAKAKQMLDSGALDKVGDTPILSAQTKDQLYASVQRYANAAEVEDRRTDKAIEDARKAAQEKWGSDSLPKLAQNALSTRDVMAAVKNGTIDWEHGERWINMIDQGAKKELRTDPRTKNQLIQRIADPNNTNPIADMNDLIPFVGKGISISDFNQMTSLFNKTPDGQALKSGEKNLLNTLKTVKFKNDLTGTQDILGEKNFSSAWGDYIQAKNSAQTMADKKALLDPNSPTYFASDTNMAKYQTTMSQRLEHQMSQRVGKANQGPTDKNQNAPPAPPLPEAKKPGESPMDNLFRAPPKGIKMGK